MSVHRDPGLQPERTSLSWTRTMFALLTVSAIFLRWIHQHGALTLIPLVVCVLAAIGIELTQRRRYRRAVSAILSDGAAPSLGSVAALSGAVVLLGALGVVVVIAG